MANVDISVNDSPIGNAIDQYYHFLNQLFQPTEKQNIALNSSLVTFDIVKEARLYTENVFRGFADRKIALSPTDFGFGSADFGDRFSERYKELLSGIVSQIDRSLSQEDLDEISALKRELKLAENELEETYIDMGSRWRRYKSEEGIEDTDPDILDKQIAFYNTFAFATKLRRLKNEVLRFNEDIEFVRQRAYPDTESQTLAKLYRYAHAEQYAVARPNNPILEAERGYDDLDLAQMWVYGNLGGVFDVGSEILPSGFLERFLENRGERGFSIKKGFESETVHDSSWKTKGSARKWFFFKVSASAEQKRHFESSVEKINEIDMKFENMAEYWVRRGRWFSASIFDFEIVKEYLDSKPDLKEDLTYIPTSVILGRGLQLGLVFDSTEEFETWNRLKTSGNASFGIFGVRIPSSAASYNSYDFNKEVDTANKKVTFFDSPNHCRLLAFRVERLIEPTDNDEKLLVKRGFANGDPETLEALSSGKLGIRDLE
jgi:hypothetical protein